MAAARRIYTIGRATAGYFAQTGYRSFGLQALVQARFRRGRPQDDMAGLARNAQSIFDVGTTPLSSHTRGEAAPSSF